MQQQQQTQPAAAVAYPKDRLSDVTIPAQQQAPQQQWKQPESGGMTSLAAHHAAAKLSQMQAAGELKPSLSTKTSPATSRSNSISFTQQGPFEAQTQIMQQQPAATAAAASGSQEQEKQQAQQQQAPSKPTFPTRPVSSRGHMLPQSAQMISEKERQREAEMEHIFAPQPGQIIAERCTKRNRSSSAQHARRFESVAHFSLCSCSAVQMSSSS